MSSTDLTGTEVAVLMVLMAQARTVTNPELVTLGPALSKPSRDKLLGHGLIEVGKTGRAITLELTDRGWKTCADLMGIDPPRGTVGAGKALFTLMGALRRWFDQEDLRPAQVFAPTAPANPVASAAEPSAPAARPADVETRIRAAYAELAHHPGAWVRLTRLRALVADVPRTDVDDTLARLRRAPDALLIPEENQKTLTDDDRAAAVRVGNQDAHLLAIRA